MSERDEATTGRPDDRDPRATREAEEAHGGSMAPGLVDDTGHPVPEHDAGREIARFQGVTIPAPIEAAALGSRI